MDSERKHWVSVGAAIVDGDRVLVIRRRDNGKWEPPGGTLEPHETILDGLRREVHEEIGIQVEPESLTGVYKNMTRGIIALVFRCTSHSGEPTTTGEVEEIRWMDQGEIQESMDSAYACRMLDAMENSGPSIRIHDGINLL